MKSASKCLLSAGALGLGLVALQLSACKGNGSNSTDSTTVKTVESFHTYFSHHGLLDETKAFFSPEIMKGNKVKTAKFFDHFAGKPDFAKDLPDELKHFDIDGRLVKEEFLSWDSIKHGYGSETWEYDASGRVIGSTIAYALNNERTDVAYTYDDGGRLINISTRIYQVEGKDTTEGASISKTIEYGAKGNIPAKIVEQHSGKESGRVAVSWKRDTLVYTYSGNEETEVKFVMDPEGRVKDMIEVDKMPAPFTKRQSYIYDDSKRPTHLEEHALEGGKYVMVNKTVWTYDPKGLFALEEVFSIKGDQKTLVDKATVEYEYHE